MYKCGGGQEGKFFGKYSGIFGIYGGLWGKYGGIWGNYGGIVIIAHILLMVHI